MVIDLDQNRLFFKQGDLTLWSARVGAQGKRVWVRMGSRARLPITYVENVAGAIVLAAEKEAGVGHHVMLSIGGIDGATSGLYAGKLVQEEIEFETSDPSLQGLMTITTTLADAEGGTPQDVVVVWDEAAALNGITVTGSIVALPWLNCRTT